MNTDEIQLDWQKMVGLLPVVVQNVHNQQVLMLGYMNEAAYLQTKDSGLVCFYSRSKQRLWTKGETSGHFLKVVQLFADCDQDTLLILAEPQGPCCHQGSLSCFGDAYQTRFQFLTQLEQVIQQRAQQLPSASYTSRLLQSGIKRIAQKVGEEGLEVALAALVDEPADFVGEVADLIYHLLVLLQDK
jgi:phosphoribosyl-AMP cyclohydrolase / phosphoribosyl-ATP pyrophosphohydrolase